MIAVIAARQVLLRAKYLRIAPASDRPRLAVFRRVGAREEDFATPSGECVLCAEAPLLRLLPLLFVAALAGCNTLAVGLGWKFGPGFSVRDLTLFAELPIVTEKQGGVYLEWRQGTSPFFFEPSYAVRDGRLLFACVATASSGQLTGARRTMKIEGEENLRALRSGGAYWWENGAYGDPPKLTRLHSTRPVVPGP